MMSLQKVVILFGFLFALALASNHECPNGVCRPVCDEGETQDGTCCRNRKCCVPGCQESPECTCKDSCDASETDNGQCVCDPTKRCCSPCTEDPICNCKTTCDADEDAYRACSCDPSKLCCKPKPVCTEFEGCFCRDECMQYELEDGPCNCEPDKKCCRPCVEQDICSAIGSCRTDACGDNEAIFGECCGEGGTCCVPCGTCTGNDVTCHVGASVCPDGENDLGGCCETGLGHGKCCSPIVEPCCGELSDDSTSPFSCKLASDPACGSSTGGSVNTGYCPTNNIKCCPECGWKCIVDDPNGQSCKKNNECDNQVNIMRDMCCQSTMCCADP